MAAYMDPHAPAPNFSQYSYPYLAPYSPVYYPPPYPIPQGAQGYPPPVIPLPVALPMGFPVNPSNNTLPNVQSTDPQILAPRQNPNQPLDSFAAPSGSTPTASLEYLAWSPQL